MKKIVFSLVTLMVMGTSTGFCDNHLGQNNNQPRQEQTVDKQKKDKKQDKQQPQQKLEKKDKKCQKTQVCKESSTKKVNKCTCKNCKKNKCKKQNCKKHNCKKHNCKKQGNCQKHFNIKK